MLAAFGEVHPRLLAEFDLRGPVAACEVFLDAVPPPKRRDGRRASFVAVHLPAVERDFAFVVDESVPADALLRAVAGAHPLVAGVSLFDVFTGGTVPEGKRSLAVAVRLTPRERTLTDDEIAAAGGRIVRAVMGATGGVLRA